MALFHPFYDWVVFYWMEEHGGLQSMGLWRVHTTEWLHFHFSLSFTGEGNGNPLHCSCLENPGDGGVWWAAVYGVAQSRTWLMWLSSSNHYYSFFTKAGIEPYRRKSDLLTSHTVSDENSFNTSSFKSKCWNLTKKIKIAWVYNFKLA